MQAFSRWLSRIATNLCLACLQKRPPGEPLPLEEPLLPHAPDQTLQVDLREALARELGTLTPTLRLPVILCDLLGHSYQDIADILMIPTGTVRSRLSAARRQLREALSDPSREVLSCLRTSARNN